MTSQKPLLSVLMPVYNAAPYIEAAVRSILEQTFIDFELLIFNDGSKDNSSDIIRSIQDNRIVFTDSVQNLGYVTHLNEGLRRARGKYIARMDADDIALPARFAQQIALLESNHEIGLCGTAYELFGALTSRVNVPLDDQEIRKYLLTDSPMGHPTVMFRKDLVDKYSLYYDRNFMPAEDFKLWYDFSKITKIENIPEVLLRYRVHSHQISSYLNDVQRNNADKVRVLQLTEKGFNLSEDEQQLYCKIIHRSVNPKTAAELETLLDLMWKIIKENNRLHAYDPLWFKMLFEFAWRDAVNNISKYNLAYLRPIFFSSKSIFGTFKLMDKIRIVIKSMLYWQSKSTISNSITLI